MKSKIIILLLILSILVGCTTNQAGQVSEALTLKANNPRIPETEQPLPEQTEPNIGLPELAPPIEPGMPILPIPPPDYSDDPYINERPIPGSWVTDDGKHWEADESGNIKRNLDVEFDKIANELNLGPMAMMDPSAIDEEMIGLNKGDKIVRAAYIGVIETDFETGEETQSIRGVFIVEDENGNRRIVTF